jgi:hypothetical protein
MGQMVFYWVRGFKDNFDIDMSKEITDVSCIVSYVCENCPLSESV